MALSPTDPLHTQERSSSDVRLMAGLLSFGALWLLTLVLTRNTPPLDNVEQWVWSQGWALGYYKHPPFPTWLAAAVHAVFGRSPLWISVMGTACVIGAVWLYARLLRTLCGSTFVTTAVLAALCVTYATVRIDFYNHNTLMLPLMAGIACLMWRVAVAPTLWAWLGIGLLMGLGLLTKYQFVLVGACVGLWWLRIGGWRQRVHVLGALLAVVAAALVFLPHVWWLVASDWAPLHYASQSSLGAHLPLGERPSHVLLWVLDWLGNRLLPAWLFLAVAWWSLRRTQLGACAAEGTSAATCEKTAHRGITSCAHRSTMGFSVLPRCTRFSHVSLRRLLPHTLLGRAGATDAKKASATYLQDPRARDLLLILGFLPLVLMALMSMFTGMRLQFKWSTAFWLWTIPAVMVAVPAFSRSAPPSSWRSPLMVGAFALLQASLLFWQVNETKPCSSERSCPWSKRSFNQAAHLADALSREHLGGPVQILSGPYGVTGVMAQELQRSTSEAPAVLIEGDLSKSPWLDAHALVVSRVVEVWPGCELPVGAYRLMPGWYATLPSSGFKQSPEYLRSDHWMIAMANGGGTYVDCP